MFAGIAFSRLCTKKTNETKPNILFICVDDLRRELGAYGSVVKTPNIDRLASQGSLFFQHYVQVPTSGASRASMLTGHFPKDKSDLSNEACRTRLSDKPEGEIPETMFHHLRRNGYYTVGIGKISHYVDGCLYGYEAPKTEKPELPYSWDEMLFDAGKWGNGWNAFFGYADGSNRQSRKKQVKPYECADVADEGYPDGLTANLAVKKLNELTAKNEPFCLAVGFFKPHLPFTSPKKYWDMYEREQIPLATNPYYPSDLPKKVEPSKEIFSYARVTDTNEEAFQREAKHGYYACVSYIDAQIGLILDELEKLGLDKNTIVVFLGDHGWALGEHTFWGKHTLFDKATHVPLIVRVPGMETGSTQSMVSFVDLYPTLCELCGLPKPEGQLQGKSLVPILKDPEASVQSEVYIQWEGGDNLVNNRYNYAEWVKPEKTIRMLFDHQEDKDENHNIASQSRYQSLMNGFSAIIRKIKAHL